MNTTQIIPTRSAERQFQVAAADIMLTQKAAKAATTSASPAPVLTATEEEVAELEAEQRRPRSYFRDGFREIEHLVLSYHQSLNEDERDDIILTLLAKLMPLREAVLRAEEIWEDESFANALASEKRRAQA